MYSVIYTTDQGAQVAQSTAQSDQTDNHVGLIERQILTGSRQ